MRIGIFTDPHINKKVQQLQADWISSVKKSFKSLVNQFSQENLDMIICGGDFFDKALIEAWSLKMVLGVLDDLNSLDVPVYFLLGNHEIESETENIIEFMDIYKNLHPITTTMCPTPEIMMIPYSDDPVVWKDQMKDLIVFTHHDIYGSSLAAGRSKAKFGLDPMIFKDAKLVINGHIHGRSSFVNIRNIGSFLSGAQGELSPKEHPRSYVLDTDTLDLLHSENYHSIHYVTADQKNLSSTLNHYESIGSPVVLRYEYQADSELDFFERTIGKYKCVLRHNLRRMIDLSNVTNQGGAPVKSLIDVPSILQRHVHEDAKVEKAKQDVFINIGIELLNAGKR